MSKDKSLSILNTPEPVKKSKTIKAIRKEHFNNAKIP